MYASECNMRLIFPVIFFRHYFHECVALLHVVSSLTPDMRGQSLTNTNMTIP